MRFRWLAAATLALTFLANGRAPAQPNATGPTVEVRLRSVNDLVDKFEYVAGLAGKEADANKVREFIKMLSTDGKGIEGIDPKKPIGAYATLAKEVESTPFVILVPIADEDQFLKALKTRLDVTPEKGDDGTLKVAVPIINVLHLRFTDGYLYVSQRVEGLGVKALITPKAFFAKDDGSVASVLVHIDRIPSDLKTMVLGQIELNLNEERKKNADNENAVEKKMKGLVFDAMIGGVKGLTEDGKELNVKLFADTKSDELRAEVTLTAKSGTATAKNFTALGSKTSLPAGIVGAANPVARGNVKVAVTDDMKKEYVALIDTLFAEMMKNPPGGEEVGKQLVDALSPTLKAGELDAATAFVGPDAKGHYQLIGAVGVKDGKEIEKLLKDLMKQFGPLIEQGAEVKFDVETIGDFNLHRIDLKDTSDKFDKVFGIGAATVWLAISDKHIAFSIEPDGATIRKGLKAKAVSVPAVSGEVAVAKLLPIVHPDLKPDELKALLKDAFGDGPAAGKDSVTVIVEGGQQLTVKFKMKGKAMRLFAGLDLLKGK